MSPALHAFLAARGFAPGAVNAADKEGLTPLMHAARLGLAGLVGELLDAGARIDAVTRDLNQPLWLACVGDEPGIVRQIIAAGADPDHANINGATALMYAASAGKSKALAALLAAGADLDVTMDGLTALDMASTRECLDLLRAAERNRERTHA